MSVALELEYEEFYPRLRVVPEPPAAPGPPAGSQRRRLLLGVVAVVLLVLLAAAHPGLGGKTIAGSAPGRRPGVRRPERRHPGVHRRARWRRTNVAGLEQRLAGEAGSTVLVPGEHLLIP